MDRNMAFASAIDLLEAHIGTSRIPGAVLGLVEKSGSRWLHACGHAEVVPRLRKMHVDTCFDLASLTKAIFTAPRVLQMLSDTGIDLDQPLTHLLPDFRQYDMGAWERQISFGDCLAHQSPLPAVFPIYTYGDNPERLKAFVLQHEWTLQTGAPVYSDINYILLGLALERHHRRPLRSMSTGPGFAFSAPAERAAATEFCPWRQRLICGEVHDENCSALHGAGHAGLFGTADAVLDHALGLLQETVFSESLIRQMRTRVSASRTLGWECAHAGWSGGERCSDKCIGHTGFTGTGLWVDFGKGLAWTLLSNRIHPTRHRDSGIVALRRAVSEVLSGS